MALELFLEKKQQNDFFFLKSESTLAQFEPPSGNQAHYFFPHCLFIL